MFSVGCNATPANADEVEILFADNLLDGGYTGTEAEFTQLCADLGVEVGHLENMTVIVNQVASSVAPSGTYVDGTLTINVPAATDAQVSSAADTYGSDYIF